MALSKDVLHHAPVEGGLSHVIAPVLAKGISGSTQIVPGDLGHHVMGDMDINIKAQELDPPGVVTMDSP